jgi:hypothetical protein
MHVVMWQGKSPKQFFLKQIQCTCIVYVMCLEMSVRDHWKCNIIKSSTPKEHYWFEVQSKNYGVFYLDIPFNYVLYSVKQAELIQFKIFIVFKASRWSCCACVRLSGRVRGRVGVRACSCAFVCVCAVCVCACGCFCVVVVVVLVLLLLFFPIKVSKFWRSLNFIKKWIIIILTIS